MKYYMTWSYEFGRKWGVNLGIKDKNTNKIMGVATLLSP